MDRFSSETLPATLPPPPLLLPLQTQPYFLGEGGLTAKVPFTRWEGEGKGERSRGFCGEEREGEREVDFQSRNRFHSPGERERERGKENEQGEASCLHEY